MLKNKLRFAGAGAVGAAVALVVGTVAALACTVNPGCGQVTIPNGDVEQAGAVTLSQGGVTKYTFDQDGTFTVTVGVYHFAYADGQHSGTVNADEDCETTPPSPPPTAPPTPPPTAPPSPSSSPTPTPTPTPTPPPTPPSTPPSVPGTGADVPLLLAGMLGAAGAGALVLAGRRRKTNI